MNLSLGANDPDDASAPSLTTLFPSGVTVGVNTKAVVKGEGLRGVTRLLISGPGVSAEIERASENSLAIRFHAKPDAVPGFRELRAEGPGGISNGLLFRVDTLKPAEESEPNDTIPTANPIESETAISARLKAQDLDHFRVDAQKGERLTIEVEARRLGVPIAPVVTILSTEGTSIRQERESPGIERDCRFSYVAPGPFVIQVRDNLFDGAEGAVYRLRVTKQPFANPMFPVDEKEDEKRIDKPGELDRFPYRVKRGDRIRVRVRAWELGSWLDSVVTVRDRRGKILAENDDAPTFGRKRVGPTSTDSLVDLAAVEDGEIVVEVTDRYGHGGLEYGYRLEIGPRKPELSARVNLSRLQALDLEGEHETIVTSDAFALKPGRTGVLSVEIETDGATGLITVMAEGLSPGLTAEPVLVDPPGGNRPAMTSALLRIDAANSGQPTSGSFRVIATAEPEEGPALRAIATAEIVHDQVKLVTPHAPVTRLISRFHVKLVGP